MQNAVFNISERTEKGKKVRMEGSIPAIMYGQSMGCLLYTSPSPRD